MYIPHPNASSSPQVATRPCPAVPQSSYPVSPRCLLVVARSGRTLSPLWTKNLPRSTNRPMVKGRFLLLHPPLTFHQTKVKVICPSPQRTPTMLTTVRCLKEASMRGLHAPETTAMETQWGRAHYRPSACSRRLERRRARSRCQRHRQSN